MSRGWVIFRRFANRKSRAANSVKERPMARARMDCLPRSPLFFFFHLAERPKLISLNPCARVLLNEPAEKLFPQRDHQLPAIGGERGLFAGFRSAHPALAFKVGVWFMGGAGAINELHRLGGPGDQSGDSPFFGGSQGPAR